MAAVVTLPSLGLAIKRARLAKWLKAEGDRVEKGDALCSVTTDKVSYEVTAPEAGVLLRRMYPEKVMVALGTPLAVIGEPGEDPDLALGQERQDASAGDRLEHSEGAQAARTTEGRTGRQKLRAYPAARLLASKLGINLTRVAGSGPGGAITREDVESFAALAPSRGEAAETPAAGKEYTVRYEGLRKAIGDHMVLSQSTAPHVTTVAEVDFTDLMHLVKQFREVSGLEKTTVLPFVAKAGAMAVRAFPVVNSTLEGDEIVVKRYVHLGVVVAVDDGLVVPVIRDCHKKSVFEIATELRKAVARARRGECPPELVSGGTLTLSNAGVFGAVLATPIIHQPQSAVLWLGRIAKCPAVGPDDVIVVRQMAFLCLSYDHRVLDGSVAARYLQLVRRYLEQPFSILADCAADQDDPAEPPGE